MALLDTQLGQRIHDKEGTLMCDGWNSKKRNHFVAFILMVDSIPHPTRTFDNLGVKRDGALAFQQMLKEKTCLVFLYNVTVVGFCIDDGLNVICFFYFLFFYFFISVCSQGL